MYLYKDDGTIFTKDFIQPNNFLLATFDPKLESAINLQAITDSIVAEAKYSDIQQLCLENPDFELSCRKGIENRVNEIYQRIESFATTDSKERYLQFKKEYGKVEALIPQHLIASYLGITPTQLSRIRKSINICK
jgi:CRP-like cAMP-binding protein